MIGEQIRFDENSPAVSEKLNRIRHLRDGQPHGIQDLAAMEKAGKAQPEPPKAPQTAQEVPGQAPAGGADQPDGEKTGPPEGPNKA